ncbi:MAG: hypothetical protein LUQ67_07340, partial [Methanomicrobiales archaeon]|nr:hypothetical protein [Methanomicrobiales archaeon]
MKPLRLLMVWLLLSCALLGGCISAPSPGRPGMPNETLTSRPSLPSGGSPAVLILSPEFDGG